MVDLDGIKRRLLVLNFGILGVIAAAVAVIVIRACSP
jgi:hypothetical protein